MSMGRGEEIVALNREFVEKILVMKIREAKCR